MEEDFLLGLTRQVKEEVIENYLTERRLIEIQVEDLQTRAQQVRDHAYDTCKRFARLSYLMIQRENVDEFMELLGVPESSFWKEILCGEFSRDVRYIHVSALTTKSKFRKLVLEAYHRLYQWMESYKEKYRELQEELRAVNANIKAFQNKFDVLTMFNFLRDMDVIETERKHFMGENFTSNEICSIDQKLCIRPLSFKELDVPEPLDLPEPRSLKDRLTEMAHEIYRNHQPKARQIIE